MPQPTMPFRPTLDQSVREMLLALCRTLHRLQVRDPKHPEHGAIYCPACDCFHTRAAEAVFPLAVVYLETGDSECLSAALALARWLFTKQERDGSWKETPQEWNGTTVFQLMSLAAAYPILQSELGDALPSWRTSIKRAADWVSANMSIRKTNVNYSPSAAAGLVLSGACLNHPQYRDSAASLVKHALAHFDRHGILHGEGPLAPRNKRILVDIGYNIDMSFGALGLYATLRGDKFLLSRISREFGKNLKFFFPDGSIDGAWGSRAYKWTCYGSKTAHGAIMALTFLRSENPGADDIASRHVEYLREMLLPSGLIGHGPHHKFATSAEPCIYPTFNRADSFAFALRYGGTASPDSGPTVPLPQASWETSLRVAEIRRSELAVSISATPLLPASVSAAISLISRTHRILNKLNLKSKYLRHISEIPRNLKYYPPSGGCITYFWHKDFGIVQLANATSYRRVEPMHMPQHGDESCVTPRIELYHRGEMYTNLYEYSAACRKKLMPDASHFRFRGALRDLGLRTCGVSYTQEYIINDSGIEKHVRLQGLLDGQEVSIVEPISYRPQAGYRVTENSLIVQNSSAQVEVFLLTPDWKFAVQEPVRSEFPYVFALPVILTPSNRKGGSENVAYGIRCLSQPSTFASLPSAAHS